MTEFRSIGFAPMTCAILGGVLTLGTVVGQHGSAPQADATAGPMAGMDHSAMAGMNHSMPGMDHSAMPGMDAAAPAAAAPGAAPMAAMDMSAPGMAASMPGGFHSSCASATCTVVFARGATGVASVLGVHARLHKLTPSAVALQVDGKPVVLRPVRQVRSHGLTITLVSADTKQASVKFRKAARAR